MTITTLGIDLAKSVFQLHGVDADGDHPATTVADFLTAALTLTP